MSVLTPEWVAGFGAWYYMKRKHSRDDLAGSGGKAGSREGQMHLAEEDYGGGSMRGPLGGQLGGAPLPMKGGSDSRGANPDKVAAMLAATKADAARARSQRLPSLKLPGAQNRYSSSLGLSQIWVFLATSQQSLGVLDYGIVLCFLQDLGAVKRKYDAIVM